MEDSDSFVIIDDPWKPGDVPDVKAQREWLDNILKNRKGWNDKVDLTDFGIPMLSEEINHE